jgi:hypothetical protein
MRRRGRRLPWREIENGPSFVGRLISYRIRRGDQDFDAIKLSPTEPADSNTLPEMYSPVLDGFSLNAFRLRGYQRVETPEGAVGVVQEWHCREP